MRFGQDGVALVKPDQNGGLEQFGGTGGSGVGTGGGTIAGGGGTGIDSEVVDAIDSNGDGEDQSSVDIFDGVSEANIRI